MKRNIAVDSKLRFASCINLRIIASSHYKFQYYRPSDGACRPWCGRLVKRVLLTLINKELYMCQFVFSFSTASQIKRALDGVRQHRGGTRTYDAIDKMHNEMFSSSLARPGVPRIAIIITDGESENTDLTMDRAEAAKADGIILFAVGVGRKINR